MMEVKTGWMWDDKLFNIFVCPTESNKHTRPGVDKVKPKGWFKYSLQFHYVLVYMGDLQCTVDPSCTEFVYPGEGYSRTPDSSEGLIPRAIICYMGIDP